MKAEIYSALAAVNRSFDVTLESLTILQQQGILTSGYVERQAQIAEEIRAGINHTVMDKLQPIESEDWTKFQQLRLETEARLKEP